MGKSRQSNGGTPKGASDKSNDETYHTLAGKDVPTDGHTKEWMEKLEAKITNWISYSQDISPSEKLNGDEMEYILNHMVDINDRDVPSGFLTRAENAAHILPLIEGGGLKVGDKLPSSAILRSYSRTQDATYGFAHDRWTPTVIYRTKGNVKHFKATDFDDSLEFVEKESFIQQNNLKIEKITRYNKNDYNDIDVITEKSPKFNKAIAKELGLKGKNMSFNQDEIIIIDVSSPE